MNDVKEEIIKEPKEEEFLLEIHNLKKKYLNAKT